MEDIEIINLWKSYDRKLNENLLLNRKNADEISKIKAQSLLSSMKPMKIFTIVVGIIWVVFIDVIIIRSFYIASSFFLVSAAILSLLNKLAIGIYLYQLILIHRIELDGAIMATQRRLASLKSTTLWIPRILFLQLPLWTTFYWTKTIFENGSIFLILTQAIVTLLFTLAAVWLFRNINYENRDKRWFRIIFNRKEWYPVIKSIELYKEIQEFK